MSWMLPTPLLVLAGILAVACVWPRLSRPTSTPRLVAESFAIGILSCAVFAAAWALYWWVEQQW